MLDGRMLKKGQRFKELRDFACKNADDVHYPELAEGVRHFKEEGGRCGMSRAVEEYAEMRAREAAKEAAKEAAAKAKKEVREAAVKSTIEDAVSYGMSKAQIVAKVCDKYKVSDKKAAMLYNKYAQLVV